MQIPYLFLIHCGYYDTSLCEGAFESHINFYIVAQNIEEAKEKAKSTPFFKERKMHIDGIQQLEAIDGFRIELKEDKKLNGESIIHQNNYRQLAPHKS